MAKKMCKTLTLGSAAVLLAACVNMHSEPPLYYWGGYPDTVYAGMQGKASPDRQLADLEKYLAQARARNQAVAPGVYAHMGMLYTQLGRLDLARRSFAEERARFPESARFMDFLTHEKGGQP